MPESAIKFGSYEVRYASYAWRFNVDHISQGSKRALARLEGHDDPKALHPWSQFFAAGMGGIISQSAPSTLSSSGQAHHRLI